MDSTCRGEREGLNCKTRRQRGCALKAGRQKRRFRVRSAPRGRGIGCGVGRGSENLTPSPRVQSHSRESSQWVAQTKKKKKKKNTQKDINVMNGNEASPNPARLSQREHAPLDHSETKAPLCSPTKQTMRTRLRRQLAFPPVC